MSCKDPRTGNAFDKTICVCYDHRYTASKCFEEIENDIKDNSKTWNDKKVVHISLDKGGNYIVDRVPGQDGDDKFYKQLDKSQ